MNNKMAAKTHEEAVQFEKNGEWLKALESYTESISFDESYAPAFQKERYCDFTCWEIIGELF